MLSPQSGWVCKTTECHIPDDNNFYGLNTFIIEHYRHIYLYCASDCIRTSSAEYLSVLARSDYLFLKFLKWAVALVMSLRHVIEWRPPSIKKGVACCLLALGLFPLRTVENVLDKLHFTGASKSGISYSSTKWLSTDPSNIHK